MNECISEVMRFILAQNSKKPGVPITYTQISTFLKGLQKQANIAKTVIAHVQLKMLSFGWELVGFKSGALAI